MLNIPKVKNTLTSARPDQHKLNQTRYQFFVKDLLQRNPELWKTQNGKISMGCLEFTTPTLPNKLNIILEQPLYDVSQVNFTTYISQKERNASGYSTIEDEYALSQSGAETPYKKLLDIVADDLEIFLDGAVGLPIGEAVRTIMHKAGAWAHNLQKDGITVSLDKEDKPLTPEQPDTQPCKAIPAKTTSLKSQGNQFKYSPRPVQDFFDRLGRVYSAGRDHVLYLTFTDQNRCAVINLNTHNEQQSVFRRVYPVKSRCYDASFFIALYEQIQSLFEQLELDGFDQFEGYWYDTIYTQLGYSKIDLT